MYFGDSLSERGGCLTGVWRSEGSPFSQLQQDYYHVVSMRNNLKCELLFSFFWFLNARQSSVFVVVIPALCVQLHYSLNTLSKTPF